jgi:hypothetical protein
MTNEDYNFKFGVLQSDAIKKYGDNWTEPFNKIKDEYKKKYGNKPQQWLIPFVTEVSFTEKSKPKKSNTNKQIKQLLKEVESTPVIKKVKTKKVGELLKKVERKAREHEGFDLISKIEKQINKEKSDIQKAIEKVNAIKPTKLMHQAKGYEHKVSDVSPRVQNYVNEYKFIVNNGKTQAGITRALNKLKLNVMTNMKPSEVDDANKLVSDFKKTLQPVDKPSKVTKSKAPKPEDGSYESDKKYKPLTAYVKKHKPHITNHEEIDIIVKEIIDKKIPRMSLKKLEEILEDLGL